MVRSWSFKSKKDAEISRSVLGESATGDITIVITGEKLDANIAYLGCQMAKGTNRRVHLLHVIEVPRRLPLKAVLSQESELADQWLNAAMQVADRIGCKAIAEVVQAREIGPAIVDEAKDFHCALILISLVLQNKHTKELDKTVLYVLNNAPCRVWLVEDTLTEEFLEIRQKR
jgi:hypothetical protein